MKNRICLIALAVAALAIFAGFPAPRMFHRWRPKGTAIRVDNPDPREVLERVRTALEKIWPV